MALHDAAAWKGNAVTLDAEFWSTYAEPQIWKGAIPAHKLIKLDQLAGPGFSTVGHGPNRTAAPSRQTEMNGKQFGLD